MFKQKHYQMEFVPLHKFQHYSKVQSILEKIKRSQLRESELLQCFDRFYELTSKKDSQYSYQNKLSYQSKPAYQNISSLNYTALVKAYRKQIPFIFASIAKFVLDFKYSYKAISILLCQSQICQISLKKGQIVYILCLMALNLVPIQQYHNDYNLTSKFNLNTNFRFIFSEQEYKTKTIIEYFKDFFSKGNQNQSFILRRQKVRDQIQNIICKNDKLKMKDFKILSDESSIEQYVGTIKVDFANKSIGGGALGKGCIQEEIMFANHPEMYVSTLLCEAMKDNQSLLFVGFKKYFRNYGYSYSVQFDRTRQDLSYKKNYEGLANQFIVAIDAKEFKHNQDQQFQKFMIDRQILKAYAGFSSVEKVDSNFFITEVTTGNWGCGAFKGDIQLKFIVQWIACTLANKKMNYCPFGHKSRLVRAVQFFQNTRFTVYDLYQLLITSSKKISEKRKYSRYQRDGLLETMQKIFNQTKKFSFKNSSKVISQGQDDFCQDQQQNKEKYDQFLNKYKPSQKKPMHSLIDVDVDSEETKQQGKDRLQNSIQKFIQNKNIKIQALFNIKQRMRDFQNERHKTAKQMILIGANSPMEQQFTQQNKNVKQFSRLLQKIKQYHAEINVQIKKQCDEISERRINYQRQIKIFKQSQTTKKSTSYSPCF